MTWSKWLLSTTHVIVRHIRHTNDELPVVQCVVLPPVLQGIVVTAYSPLATDDSAEASMCSYCKTVMRLFVESFAVTHEHTPATVLWYLAVAAI